MYIVNDLVPKTLKWIEAFVERPAKSSLKEKVLWLALTSTAEGDTNTIPGLLRLLQKHQADALARLQRLQVEEIIPAELWPSDAAFLQVPSVPLWELVWTDRMNSSSSSGSFRRDVNEAAKEGRKFLNQFLSKNRLLSCLPI